MTTAFQPNAFQNNAFQIDADTGPTGGGGGSSGVGYRRVPRHDHLRELEHQAQRNARKLERDETDTRLLEAAWNKEFGLPPEIVAQIGTDMSPAQLAALSERLWQEQQASEQEEMTIILLLAM